MEGGFDRKSLQDLEEQDWGEPTFHSYLVETCHRLRRKPLIEFTTEDLRIMIGQQISLPLLIPLAVERLEAEPLAEGNYYPGDLLAAVLKVDGAFWLEHLNSCRRIRQVVGRVRDALLTLDELHRPGVERLLRDAPQWLTT